MLAPCCLQQPTVSLPRESATFGNLQALKAHWAAVIVRTSVPLTLRVTESALLYTVQPSQAPSAPLGVTTAGDARDWLLRSNSGPGRDKGSFTAGLAVKRHEPLRMVFQSARNWMPEPEIRTYSRRRCRKDTAASEIGVDRSHERGWRVLPADNESALHRSRRESRRCRPLGCRCDGSGPPQRRTR